MRLFLPIQLLFGAVADASRTGNPNWEPERQGNERSRKGEPQPAEALAEFNKRRVRFRLKLGIEF